jgi:hypothetical protein
MTMNKEKKKTCVHFVGLSAFLEYLFDGIIFVYLCVRDRQQIRRKTMKSAAPLKTPRLFPTKSHSSYHFQHYFISSAFDNLTIPYSFSREGISNVIPSSESSNNQSLSKNAQTRKS